MLKKLIFTLLLAPVCALATNNNPTPDLLAAMQQQMLAMQQQMMAMQAEQRQRETREQELLREIATLKAEKNEQPLRSFDTPIGYSGVNDSTSNIEGRLPMSLSNPQGDREEEKKQEPARKPSSSLSNSSSPASRSYAIGVGPQVQNGPEQRQMPDQESKQPEQGPNAFLETPLMRAAAAGDVQLARQSLAAEDGGRLEFCNRLLPGMINPEATINARAICQLFERVRAKEFRRPYLAEKQILLRDAVTNYELSNLLSLVRQTALSLAAVGGHADVVELLLDAMTSRLDRNDIEAYKNAKSIIGDAIDRIFVSSHVVDTSFADELFAHIGFPEKPSQENYPDILRMLLAAQNKILPVLDEDHIQNNRPFLKLPSFSAGLPFSLYGAPELSNLWTEAFATRMVQAEGLAARVGSPGLFARLPQVSGLSEAMARQFISGERIGFLLATFSNVSDPGSMGYRMNRELLNHIQRNPTLLARLKAYVRAQQANNQPRLNLLSQHHLPVISDLISRYEEAQIPVDIARHILAMEPLTEDRNETEHQLVQRLGLLERERLLGQLEPAPEAEPAEQGLLQHLQNMERNNQ